jgi:hypothetical protein
MVVVTERLGLPGVAAVAKKLARHVTETPDKERRAFNSAVGRMVRAIMVANGWETTGTKRAVPPIEGKRIFGSGEVYDRRSGANPATQ